MKKKLFALLLLVLTAVSTGSAVALFLWLLNQATLFRFQHAWLLFLLPLAGIVIHFIYRLAGASSERGNSLIIDEIHAPGGGVPPRMAPVILLTTLITHLFGGSAGREGTAVQMGGSIAALLAKKFNITGETLKMLLITGMSAGFGAVFGTPLAGAIFAIEVLIARRFPLTAFLPALLAGIIADQTVAAWGIHHTVYTISPFIAASSSFLLFLAVKVLIAAVLFGLTAYVFARSVQEIKAVLLKVTPRIWLIPVIGAVVLILLTSIIHRPDYLGLGVIAEYPGAVTLPSAFHAGGAQTWSWLLKISSTVITLGTGFKGGEVTPLFFIGATLGNTLSQVLNAPVSLFAALGFIAVFAGATNTPVACTIMGAELFGPGYLFFFAIACFTAYFFSGRTGIYSAHGKGWPGGFRTTYWSAYFRYKYFRYYDGFRKKGA